MTIAIDDPRRDDVRALLARHLAYNAAHTKPEDVFALDVAALLDPAVTFFSYREAGELLGVAALKRLDDDHVELKSMHTAQAARRRGVGRALVDHLVAAARERGYSRISLETGAGSAYTGARALYTGAGFTSRGAFGDYDGTSDSVYLTLALTR